MERNLRASTLMRIGRRVVITCSKNGMVLTLRKVAAYPFRAPRARWSTNIYMFIYTKNPQGTHFTRKFLRRKQEMPHALAGGTAKQPSLHWAL